MRAKIVIAGIVAGIAVFAWESVWHMVLPFGETGVKSVLNEDPIIAAMRDNMHERGYYFVPGAFAPPDATKEQKGEANKQWAQKAAAGPNAIIVYNPNGYTMGPRLFVTEFLLNVVLSWIAAMLLAQASGALPKFGSRVIFVTWIGVFGALATNVAYWNWYNYPPDFSVAAIAEGILAGVVMGLVLAPMIKPSVPASDTSRS
ncbi:MAG: hypothetical protein ACREJQ_08290 [bacterium]